MDRKARHLLLLILFALGINALFFSLFASLTTKTMIPENILGKAGQQHLAIKEGYAPLRSGETVTVYVYGRDMVASYNNDQVRYHIQDHVKSNTLIVDAKGLLKSKITTYPYGNGLAKEGSSETAHKYTFTGKESDSENLMYFNARYYSPRTAEFLSVDPVMKASPSYAYAARNPFSYIDPDGMDEQDNKIRIFSIRANKDDPGRYAAQQPGDRLIETDTISNADIAWLAGHHNNFNNKLWGDRTIKYKDLQPSDNVLLVILSACHAVMCTSDEPTMEEQMWTIHEKYPNALIVGNELYANKYGEHEANALRPILPKVMDILSSGREDRKSEAADLITNTAREKLNNGEYVGYPDENRIRAATRKTPRGFAAYWTSDLFPNVMLYSSSTKEGGFFHYSDPQLSTANMQTANSP